MADDDFNSIPPDRDDDNSAQPAEKPHDASVSDSDGAKAAPTEPRKNPPHGSYWYTLTEESELIKLSQIRSLIYIIALMLQLVILALPQKGLEYVTYHISSYAFIYMWCVFIMGGISLYVIIASFTRNKIRKRIPVERAPRGGFARRAFFASELLLAVNAVMFVFELSFVCIKYDGFGLLGMFLALASLGMTVWGRETEHLALKDAELVLPPDCESNDGTSDDTDDGEVDSINDDSDTDETKQNRQH